MAVTRCEIGLTLTNASSGPGRVEGSTNALLRNVRGKIAMKPAFITALGERISRPRVVNTHDSPNENTTTSASPASRPGRPAGGS